MPAAAGTEAAAANCVSCGSPLPRQSARTATILWIDDDRLVLGMCVPALEREGYEVLFATDGAAGIALAKQTPPDLILLDVVMPEMHGFEVCQALRRIPGLQETPIILLTALGDTFMGVGGERAGATTIIRKPFGVEYILKTITGLLGHRSSTGKPR
jgi:DNA-binding response OmpR family regulator